MKPNLLNSVIPPLIGGILITALALIWEIAEDTTHLEACEVYDLSSAHYLTLLIGGTLLGAVIQFVIIEQVFKVLRVQNIIHWLLIGLSLTLLIGTCLALLTRLQSIDLQEMLIAIIPTYFIALVFVAGILISSRRIKLRHSRAITS